jgi:hypothetical protein
MSNYYKVSDAFYRNTIPIPRSKMIDLPYLNVPTYQAPSPPQQPHPETKVVKLKWQPVTNQVPSDPKVWGPALWFSLHVGATKYPVKASQICAELMKGFIFGIPIMVACEKCSEHARAHIEANYHRLDKICSGRDELFKFFWEFHSFVNKRYNKPNLTLEEAWAMYTGKATVDKLTYSTE